HDFCSMSKEREIRDSDFNRSLILGGGVLAGVEGPCLERGRTLICSVNLSQTSFSHRRGDRPPVGEIQVHSIRGKVLRLQRSTACAQDARGGPRAGGVKRANKAGACRSATTRIAIHSVEIRGSGGGVERS